MSMVEARPNTHIKDRDEINADVDSKVEQHGFDAVASATLSAYLAYSAKPDHLAWQQQAEAKRMFAAALAYAFDEGDRTDRAIAIECLLEALDYARSG